MTLELENGEIDLVPAHLTKATPNFHLLMPALDEDDEFCRTTLSAMILNYPPPTIINFYDQLDTLAEGGKAHLEGILNYLKDGKMVNEEDLVLIVDGRDTWFQLPSDVFIRQYQNVLEDANKRLASRYRSNFTQTIVFGALKTCEGEDLACKYFPQSMLPGDIYGKGTGKVVENTPASYLNADMVMGPVGDLRALYEAAIKVFEEKKSQQATVQSVMATLFGEQQMARQAQRKRVMKRIFNETVKGGRQHEFKIGLDYTHTLFQPLTHCATGELVPLIHDNSTDLSHSHHHGTPTPPLIIPSALQQAKLPFWTPDFAAHNPSPNEKPAYIDKLEINIQLDSLKPRNTTWEQIKLIQNTYTGAIPATFHVNNRPASQIFHHSKRATHKRPSTKDISWKSLWYAGYERALLRKYFRNPQSPVGYHTAAIGGDRLWDLRGGRGGVWTEKEGLWLPWGEVDGVCGSVRQMRRVFGDERGVWLHELDDGKGEAQRQDEERELKERILEKEREAKETREKEEKERLEQEQWEEDANRNLINEQKIKEGAQRLKEEGEEAENVKQEKERKAYEEGQDRLDYEDADEGNDQQRYAEKGRRKYRRQRVWVG
ncbi:hypothetical protein K458DRAFT_412951 [Lentithecium fluviatile CBS 122367]|uniref:Uncharacterized protein n=1 Tax=Lentithecium fluviatile CBS 122367 TaxID=1168545 RepID=A0A6G1JI57_9PLEO|nr:hypothetical protein K458DRAFT_412951 [Lentithecium fluviatile CBS 122367]